MSAIPSRGDFPSPQRLPTPPHPESPLKSPIIPSWIGDETGYHQSAPHVGPTGGGNMADFGVSGSQSGNLREIRASRRHSSNDKRNSSNDERSPSNDERSPSSDERSSSSDKRSSSSDERSSSSGKIGAQNAAKSPPFPDAGKRELAPPSLREPHGHAAFRGPHGKGHRLLTRKKRRPYAAGRTSIHHKQVPPRQDGILTRDSVPRNSVSRNLAPTSPGFGDRVARKRP